MRAHTSTPPPRGIVGSLTALAATVRMVWCCAGPLIVGGAGLSATGALRNAWLITVGGLIVLMGTGHALRCRGLRRRGLAGPDDCCPNVSRV
jgi:hypothetical protein